MFEETPHPELSALPLAQLRLLWTVFFSPDATMKFFSERLNVSQSTLTQLAERLVRRGLIERMHDSADRRVVRLRVTATGRRVLEEASASQHHTFAKVWDTLASKERALVLRGLETLGRAAEEVRAAEGRPIIHAPPCPAGGEDQTPDLVAAAQPVVNLMARRIRGKAAG
jgi:DNA-binding MarR family transcriptional regulator